MKFYVFAEQTYPYLPSDYGQRYRNSWVIPPRREADPAKTGEALRAYIRMYEYADEMGFDGMAINEHHQTFGAMTPSPNLEAAILARTTKNASILVIGDSLALYNPPTRVAEEFAIIDCISDGRLIAGFVVGSAMDSVYAYGYPPVEVRERYAEAHELILKAWDSDDPFTFNGKYTQLRYVNVWPRPIQRPRPPVWVPGSGSIETWDFVIDNDYCYGHLSFSGLGGSKSMVDAFWEYVDGRGGEMNPNRMAFIQIVCCSETDAKAEEEYAEAVQYFYSYTNLVSRGFTQAPGYRTERSTRWELERRKQHPRRLADAIRGKMTFKDYVENGFVVAGSPATVAAQLENVAREVRAGQMLLMPHMGNLSEEQTKKNIHLLATEVLPRIRHVHAEHEDRWSPQGLAEIARKKAAAVATGAR